MNKNGNIVYLGIFRHARYFDGRFYTAFTNGVREIPNGSGSSIRQSEMTKEQFYKLPKVKRIERN